MNYCKILICLNLALLLSLSSIAQQTKGPKAYYVSLAGNDADPGTQARPFKSLARVNRIQLRAGDFVYLKSGEVFKGSIVIDSADRGTKRHPVIITSLGKGRAIIDARNENALLIKGTSYISIKQLGFKGSGRKNGNTRDGIRLDNASKIILTNLDVQGFQKSGLLIFASNHIVSKNISSHDNGSAGITVEARPHVRDSRDIQLLYCRAENNAGDPTNLTTHSGNGIIVGNCKNVLIDHCTATNNGWDMPRIGNGPVGIWAYEADSVIIQHCLAYKNKTSKGGADGGGFDFDGGVTNSIIQYCLSYDNQGSGYCIFQYLGASPWGNNIFRYNISENDGTVSESQAGIYVWNSSDDEKQLHDCDVYGNIIYNSKVAAISFSEKSISKGLHFYNNVFIARDTLIRGKDINGNVKYTGNDWWSLKSGFKIDQYKDFQSWAIAENKERIAEKIVGLNEKVEFRLPGKSAITSATQLQTFKNYELPEHSPVRNKPVYTSQYGLKNLKL
jgi:hypothetical protein